MQRPQPVQPLRPYCSTQLPNLCVKPLFIAAAGIRSDMQAVNVAVAFTETGVPLTLVLRLLAIKRRGFSLAVTETTGADGGTVAATEAGISDPVPGWVFTLMNQTGWIEGWQAPLLAACLCGLLDGFLSQGGIGRNQWQGPHDTFPAHTPGL